MKFGTGFVLPEGKEISLKRRKHEMVLWLFEHLLLGDLESKKIFGSGSISSQDIGEFVSISVIGDNA
jgi:hypothetical protein